MLKRILSWFGFGKSPKTVDQLIAPLKKTIDQLEAAVLARTTAVEENTKRVEELKKENEEHRSEVERAQRVQTNIKNLLQ